MQHNIDTRVMISRIAKKEITLFFASPIAYLFLVAFAGFTLFVFFWGSAFFARNISDVRPLFESMPLLLIFLASALTMRLWSEERRTGTLEYVLTQPVPLWHFVLGKFCGCLALLAIALMVTLPLPISVAILGDLDWGPVIAGYLATFLLGAAYLSIGLFVSSRSQNQIVSLIISVALCGFFYMLGAKTIVDLVGSAAAEWFRLFGTGSRFSAITRGVIDFRDLYYYISIIIVFLALNTYSLEKERWATGFSKPNHTAWRTITALVLLNAIGGNLWLGQMTSLRIDTTEGNQYSISQATKNYLQQLKEPLLLRGYFSEKTHPLLAPLVPQLRDLLKEYEIAGDGKVRVEFVNPADDPEAEDEANQKYQIRPEAFQVADRYQSAIVSSYFNVLLQYGDEYETLGFRDFIEVKASVDADIDVQLRNPEHDLTRAIKKVLKNYQSGGNLFDFVDGQISFEAYISADANLPEELRDFKGQIEEVIEENKAKAGDRLSASFVVPEANGGAAANEIAENYGFQPMATSLFSDESFYFYLLLRDEKQAIQIPMGDMNRDSFIRNFDASLKRFATGFTKTVAVVVPESNPQMAAYGMAGPQFRQLEQFLGSELNTETEDLKDGSVSGAADILMLLAPKELDENSLFAVDQFLMQGGTVMMASSPFAANMTQRSIDLVEHTSGLEDWLTHHGLSMDKKVVMDSQNAAFPIPVTRNVGGFSLQDIKMLDYPYFVDVRGAGLNEDSIITSDLPQLTLTWASPIVVDEEKNASRDITTLFSSSDSSWLSSSMDIMPKIEDDGAAARYVPSGTQSSHVLGVISAGKFDSFYAGKDSPLLAKAEEDDANSASEVDGENDAEASLSVSSVIEKSSESARIILFSSNDFLQDQIVGMLGSAQGSQYMSSYQLVANTIDWSLEDVGLLSIRSRGHFNRTLPPMEKDEQVFWEYLNYICAVLALVVLAAIQRFKKNSRRREFEKLITA